MAGLFDFFRSADLLSMVGTGMEAAGRFGAARAIEGTGVQQKQLADFQAAQLRMNAGQAMAASQRAAYDEERRSKYLQSAALAAAAASGGGASDPTVINIIAGIAAEGAYQKEMQLYQGQDRARSMELQADATEYEGNLREVTARQTGRAKKFGAYTTLAKSFLRDSSMFQRFGGDGPSINTAD